MKVLLLGSGALKIGQAGEFDYSGSQAIKALKEDNVQVILINPNIATVQTSHGLADKVYFLPVEPHFVEEIIKAEKPDGILLSFGGQTALNCGLNLFKSGVFKKYNVKILGTSVNSINQTEDRSLFVKSLKSIKLKVPKSQAAATLNEAKIAAGKIGYPVMIRGGFSLGGQDSGIATKQKDLEEIAGRALSKTPQILIEEYLKGFKEIEYEVVRDKFDNCITVCNMENFDPMGIHTGESIVVAPSQTLNNFEYHTLREISLKVIRHLKIVGECNIQFALNPNPKTKWEVGNGNMDKEMRSGKKNLNPISHINNPHSHIPYLTSNLDYRIIEVNARLSRSSALASKATGYPLAYVAAKLALGQSLTEITNSVTKKTIACFEPALDYLVVKLPRWDLSKFIKSEATIGSYMQSVGEVMAIGRKFEEAIQKAVRMLDVNLEGLTDKKAKKTDFKKPTPWRLFSIAQKLKTGESSQKINKLTGIDPFFLEKIRNITDLEKKIERSQKLTKNSLTLAKKYGFSDNHIASLVSSNSQEIRRLRKKHKIIPHVKQIDTLAAEYPAQTNYLYLTYNGDSDDIDSKWEIRNESVDGEVGSEKNLSPKSHINNPHSHISHPTSNNKVIILGSGPYRIGSSVEFDWCSVNTAQTAANNKIAPIVINCNPETVSTDYDMAERLYFEELTEETVFEIYEKEKPLGIIVSMGGQRPNNLTPNLAKLNLKILGTTPKSIDNAENRNKFSALCDKLEINQPPWAMLKTVKDATKFAQKIGFPVLVRPSYVLSGAAMNVAGNREDLKEYLAQAANVSEKYPVVISKFMQNAKEIEIDAVATGGRILCHAISEHVENAGVHSGDSTLVLPAQKLYTQTVGEIQNIAQKISNSLKITGPFNIQFLAINNKVSVIECNLRASRSLPFVSKVTGINFAKVATEAILGKTLNPLPYTLNPNGYVAVKSPQFSFARIKGADPVLRVEMASTGEVATFGDDIYEAFLKSIIATGTSLPKKSVFISLAGEESKLDFLASAKILWRLGLKIYATAGTSKFLEKNGVENKKLFKIYENKKPNVLDVLSVKKVDLVINIFDPYFKKEFDDDYQIRRYTIDFGIPLLVNLQTAELFVKAISVKKLSDLKALPWSHYVQL